MESIKKQLPHIENSHLLIVNVRFIALVYQLYSFVRTNPLVAATPKVTRMFLLKHDLCTMTTQ